MILLKKIMITNYDKHANQKVHRWKFGYKT